MGYAKPPPKKYVIPNLSKDKKKQIGKFLDDEDLVTRLDLDREHKKALKSIIRENDRRADAAARRAYPRHHYKVAFVSYFFLNRSILLA